MITKYKFIHFRKIESTDDIEWACINNKASDFVNDVFLLGGILFYKPWKQYIMTFREERVFNNQCLKDIAHFLEQLNQTKSKARLQDMP